MEKTYAIIRWNKKEKPTLEELKKRLEEERLTPSRFDFPPGDYYGEHTHPDDEVRVIVEGKMMFGLPELNKEVILEAGDRLDVKAGTVHYAKVLGKEGVISLTASK